MDRSLVSLTLAATTGHAILYGPYGTAKSTTAVESARPGQTVFQTTFTAEDSSAQHMGHYVPRGPEFVWHKGPMQRAWEEAGLLVINEIDHGSEDTENLLHVVLDDGLGAYYTLPTGETISPKPGFRCIATMNGELTDLTPAVRDRFRIRIPVFLPSQEQLDSLPPAIAATCLELYRKGQFEETTFRMLAGFVRVHKEMLDSGKFDPAKAEELAATVTYGNQEKARALLKAIKLNEAALKVGGGT